MSVNENFPSSLDPAVVEQHNFMAKYGAYMRSAAYNRVLEEFFERFFKLWFHLWPHADQKAKRAVRRLLFRLNPSASVTSTKEVKRELFYYGLNLPHASATMHWEPQMFLLEVELGIDSWVGDSDLSSPLY
ncbi:hypothetical protein CVT26_010482 [Gymnopilus dilepis]|uniref:Uncharacterized protein n=1 Tax=Gymnopilus dilepis TaxID=231916 RepID=A0A409Y0F9_9AGAR|nr:hypothetical protein CVT26_010482 [Gymnopilus dilepis]